MDKISGMKSGMKMDTFKGMENMKDLKTPEALEAAATEMEAGFIYELLKVMRESVGNGTIYGKGLGADTYAGLFDIELSRVLAQRGVGMKDMLVEQLGHIAKKNTPPGEKKQQDAPLPTVKDLKETTGNADKNSRSQFRARR